MNTENQNNTAGLRALQNVYPGRGLDGFAVRPLARPGRSLQHQAGGYRQRQTEDRYVADSADSAAASQTVQHCDYDYAAPAMSQPAPSGYHNAFMEASSLPQQVQPAHVAQPIPAAAAGYQAVETGQPSVAAQPAEPVYEAAQERLLQFDLPRYHAPQHSMHIVRRRRRWLRTAVRGLAMTTAVVIMTGGFLVWRGYSSFHKVFRGTTTVAALSSQGIQPDALRGEGSGRVNVLLLGAGGLGHDGPDLTDTIIVLSVDTVNNTADLLSVPRDLWVKMPAQFFGPNQKINAAYSAGKYHYLGRADASNNNQKAVDAGFASVDSAVSEVLGIDISYNVLVDFHAFEQAVNTVGGVTVDVKDRLYDPTMAWENANNPVLAEQGVQQMDGRKALMYARSRETSSDFARGERQRQLLLALRSKVLTLGTLSNPAKLSALMDSFGDNVHTDLSSEAAFRLVSIMRKIGDTNMRSLSLTEPEKLVVSDTVGNSSVVRPQLGFGSYSAIQEYVQSKLVDGYILKEQAPVQVVAEDETAGANVKDTLSRYGYKVSGPVAAVDLPAGITIVDLSDGHSPYTLRYLQDRYGIAAITQMPAGLRVPNGTQFVILAGR